MEDIFFDNLEDLNRYTLNHDMRMSYRICQYCNKSGCFVSHGFVRKKIGDRISGKRIVCSKRYSNNGCGRTKQLYLKDILPQLWYTAPHVYCFILTLFSGISIQKAYVNATKTDEPKNAFRWLKKLFLKSFDFRAITKQNTQETASSISKRSKQNHQILFLIKKVFELFLSGTPIDDYQMKHQLSFL